MVTSIESLQDSIANIIPGLHNSYSSLLKHLKFIDVGVHLRILEKESKPPHKKLFIPPFLVCSQFIQIPLRQMPACFLGLGVRPEFNSI